MTETVYEQIMAVGSSGVCNMLNVTDVQRHAYDHNMFKLVVFLDEHKKEYVDFVFHGKREETASK